MTQEQQQILLQYLCAALPYNYYIGDEYGNKWELIGIEIDANTVTFKQQSNKNLGITPIKDIKPYLRPMSSITKKESNDLANIYKISKNDSEYIANCTDYLLSHYLDYRGLIEKRLALPAPYGMYN